MIKGKSLPLILRKAKLSPVPIIKIEAIKKRVKFCFAIHKYKITQIPKGMPMNKDCLKVNGPIIFGSLSINCGTGKCIYSIGSRYLSVTFGFEISVEEGKVDLNSIFIA